VRLSSNNNIENEPLEGKIISDGLEIAYLDWHATNEVYDNLLVLHPNGFCAGMFDPVVDLLREHYRVVGVDLRGHGASEEVLYEADLGNDLMASDALKVMASLRIDTFSILGVSLGGAIAIEIAAMASEKVQVLMLCEAIAMNFDSRKERTDFLEAEEHPLAVGARRRRSIWSNREEIQNSYGSRKPLDALEPSVLKAYIKWGFVDRDDGQVELACNPETEATIFGSRDRYGPISTFERLSEVKAKTHILAGTQTDLGKVWFEQQAKEINTEVTWIEGGHFFFFEDLERAFSLIRRCIG
jgi:pimeloyl-ACP methyl ester carboxylesterase